MNKRDLKKFQENYTPFDSPQWTPDFFKRRGWPAEGLRLAVHFDQKDVVKQWGAKWNSEEKYWWLPAMELQSERMHLADLNHRKMVVGWHGSLDDDLCTEWIGNDAPDQEYNLVRDDATLTVRTWKNHDLIQVAKGASEADPAGSIYETIERGRTSWNNLMERGWRRLVKNDALSC